ncbi:uncharacterized protein CC84DRAFT_1128323 [Paraphaeosphaeria sporulosa]|uniref:Uncharacterized protein n=1 Tax=Paraphaeosphaeria sporulosa TaxID=1460663 RepID=A0A177C2P8_9PLEO|nr:uncharacterized protein CC84DRAFT_1128323 [Paraphaeosphaeria sporulosa]OAG01017.1 hypothetical protein CC84DRAFT_1128323 [Paraphaeosphaeria sporulosa]
MCEVYMSTHDGGECYASVECDEDNGGKKEYKNFPNCRVGGHSRFEDDRIGPFSIEFSERDGEGQGEGLTTPNLRLKYLNEWEPIAVNSEAQRQSTDGSAGEYGKAFLCKYGNYKASIIGSHISNQRTKKYSCGVPRAGLQSEDGTLDSNMPEDKKGYRSGTCSFHVKQFQKPDPSRDDYALEISSVKDANEKKIGGKGKAGPDVVLKTKLPKTISFKTGNVDADPVSFQYGDDKWTSDDEGRCSVGKYDSGDREMDCTFKCD